MLANETKDVLVRFPPELLLLVDGWKDKQRKKLSRHHAILLLIECGLNADMDIKRMVEVERRLRPLVTEMRAALEDVLQAPA